MDKQHGIKMKEIKVTGKQKSSTEVLFHILSLSCVWLGITSIGYAFLAVFQIEIAIIPFCIGMLVICCLWMGIFWYSKQVKVTLPIVLILYFIIVYRLFPSIGAGFYRIANAVIMQINQYYHTSFTYANVIWVSGNDVLICCFILLFLPAGILTLGTMRYLTSWVLIVLAAGPVGLALAVGLVPPMMPCMALLVSLSGILGLRSIKQKKYICRKADEIKSDLGTVRKIKNQISWSILIVLPLLVIASMLIGPLLTPKFENMKEIRQKVQNSTFEELYQEVIEQLPELNFDFLPGERVTSGGISGGKLGRADRLENKNTLHLQVTSSETLSGKLYLRAFVGTIYSSNRWEPLEGTGNIPQSIAKQRQSKEYSRLNMLGLSSQEKNKIIKTNITVENIAASRSHNYVPYFSNLSNRDDIETDIFDATIKKGKDKRRDYESIYWNGEGEEEWNQLDRSADVNTFQDDLEYHNFVYQKYLQLPESGLERLSERLKDVEVDSTKEAVAFVKDMLSKTAVYSMSPGSTPKDKDFVEYFMCEQQKGYCMHFASAGTVLFRMLGIPARYVEGYTVIGLTKEKTIDVLDTNAHAWAEIWTDSFGWLPVEVTPGFEGNSIPQPESSNEEETVPMMEPKTTQEVEESVTAAPVTPTMDSTELSYENRGTSRNGLFGNGIKSILFTSSLFILAAAGILIRRNYLLRQRERWFQGNPRLAVIAIGSELYRMSRFLGNPIDEYTDGKTAEEGGSYIHEEEYEWLSALLKEAKFSDHGIKKESRIQAEKLYEKFSQTAFQQMNGWKRFLFRYFYCFF